MREWNQRPKEVKYLFNPAFCGRVLYAMVAEYQKNTSRALPFPLVYLILPLVLPKQTRERISSKTQLMNWVQANQALMYNYGKRANDLISITNTLHDFFTWKVVKYAYSSGITREYFFRESINNILFHLFLL